MPGPRTTTDIRLNNVSMCVALAADTLDVLVKTLKISGLEPVANTTQSLLKLIQTQVILSAIIGVYIKSDTGIELPPSTLNEIANFTQTLHKIHTFIEAQQSGSKVKKFFRQGELNGLLKDCKTGLQEGIKFFQIDSPTEGSLQIRSSDIMSTAREIEEQAQIRHQEVLNIIETLSSSDSASTVSEPKIFHGRESELADILEHFRQDTARIAILGAGGMGKTSLAQTVLHYHEIIIKYQENRLFVACDTASNKVELAGLVGAHLGMKPGKD
ncbi:hypothetical protein B0H16DRAFT_1706165 [Mycena metata]|uniref:Uncharacterized protein n=1 Tax=Mycena metata TaxID=1033252 RepID=A0AAD7GNS8_9AGAR|nr:hypothetical protein B0H16DRAFT_1706165 [Mycena metata]